MGDHRCLKIKNKIRIREIQILKAIILMLQKTRKLVAHIVGKATLNSFRATAAIYPYDIPRK